MNGKLFRVFWMCLAIGVAFPSVASARLPESRAVDFHQDYLQKLGVQAPDLAKSAQVLAYILTALGDEIIVYPSEGYYYFSFLADGNLIRGNLRFSPELLAKGELSFAYFFDDPAHNQPLASQLPEGQIVGKDEGLGLSPSGPLKYMLRYGERTITVKIYDAALERANPPALNMDEIFVGPTYDDSGVRFSLIFNRTRRTFYFLLNNQFGHSEEYEQLDVPQSTTRILIGKRTRFAFAQTPADKRMYLIGVSSTNVALNTHFDGPFDQLPDFFVDPDRLRDLIIESDPSQRGLIGSYGNYLDDQETRYAIAPYIEYSSTGQLASYASCIGSANIARPAFCPAGAVDER